MLLPRERLTGDLRAGNSLVFCCEQCERYTHFLIYTSSPLVEQTTPETKPHKEGQNVCLARAMTEIDVQVSISKTE